MDRQLELFLNICLKFGNLINKDTKRGDAHGFHLESIDRLHALKTTNNNNANSNSKNGNENMSMLMLIIDFIENHETLKEEFEGFPNNLQDIVLNARKIETKDIRDTLGDIEHDLEIIGKKISRANRNLSQLHKQFGRRVSGVLSVLKSLQFKGAKLKAKQIAKDMYDTKNLDYDTIAKKRLSTLDNTFIMGNPSLGSPWPSISGPKIRKLTYEVLNDNYGMSVVGNGDAGSTGDDKNRDGDRDRIPVDRFSKVMTSFHTYATNHVEGCQFDYKTLIKFTNETSIYFGENDDLKWENLFDLFKNFFNVYQNAKKQLIALNKQKAKELERKKSNKHIKHNKHNKNMSGKNNNDNDIGGATNILDEIRYRNAAGTLTSTSTS